MECRKCHANMEEACKIPNLYQRWVCPKCNSQFTEYWNKTFSPNIQYEIEEHDTIYQPSQPNILKDVYTKQDWVRGVHIKEYHNGTLKRIEHYNSLIQGIPFGRKICSMRCPFRNKDHYLLIIGEESLDSSFEYTCKNCDFHKECTKRLNDQRKLTKFIKMTYKTIQKDREKIFKKLDKHLSKTEKPRKSLADHFLEFIRYKDDENETLQQES